MLNKPFTHWMRLALKGIVPAILLILITTQALAAPACKKVKGKFTLQAITGTDCTSSTGFCATGTYTGDLPGTSLFTGTSLIPTVDTPTMSVLFLTGDTTITTNGGTLLTEDAIH